MCFLAHTSICSLKLAVIGLSEVAIKDGVARGMYSYGLPQPSAEYFGAAITEKVGGKYPSRLRRPQMLTGGRLMSSIPWHRSRVLHLQTFSACPLRCFEAKWEPQPGLPRAVRFCFRSRMKQLMSSYWIGARERRVAWSGIPIMSCTCRMRGLLPSMVASTIFTPLLTWPSKLLVQRRPVFLPTMSSTPRHVRRFMFNAQDGMAALSERSVMV